MSMGSVICASNVSNCKVIQKKRQMDKIARQSDASSNAIDKLRNSWNFDWRVERPNSAAFCKFSRIGSRKS